MANQMLQTALVFGSNPSSIFFSHLLTVSLIIRQSEWNKFKPDLNLRLAITKLNGPQMEWSYSYVLFHKTITTISSLSCSPLEFLNPSVPSRSAEFVL